MGWEIAKTVLKEANVSLTPYISFESEVVAVDALFLMKQISTKPISVRTGKDLAKEFYDRLDKQSEGAEIIVVGFEWYSDASLKAKAWESRQKGKKKEKQLHHRTRYRLV